MLVCVAAHLLVASSYRAGPQDLPATYFAPKAQEIADGATPYRQVPYEYPPGTIPLLLAPRALGGDTPTSYHQRMIWLYAGVDVAIILLLGHVLRRRPWELAGALVVWSACVLGLGRVSLTRFDIVVGLAVLVAALALERRPRIAGAALGIGAALKIGPLAGAAGLPRRSWVPALALPIAAQLAFLAVTGSWGLEWVRYHLDRSPQLESWAAVVAELADRAGIAGARIAFDHGSWNAVGSLADLAGRLSAVALVGAVVLVARRARPSAIALLAGLGAVVAFGSVLSPQYLLWLAPLSALIAARYPLQAVLLVATCALTRLELWLTIDDLPALSSTGLAVLVARNVVLLGWLVVVYRASARNTSQEGLRVPLA